MNRRDITSLVISLAMHAAFVAILVTLPLDLPDDFELALPVEVQFGVIEELEAEEAPEAPPPVPEPAESKRAAPKPPKTEEEAEDETNPEPEPEVPEPEPASPPPPASRIPAGSQIALRIDMSQVRGSRLSGPARKLISQIPDWHLLAGGSGIDPIDGLDRLLIATPDPRRRDLIVLAGKSVGDEATIRGAAETIAASQGKSIEFTKNGGITVAPWHSIDPTERTIALIGPRHFAITQPSVLGTVLAMTRHRERSGSQEGLSPDRGPDALLSLGDGEAISIEVENVASYARRLPCAIPEKGRASIRETETGVEVEARVFHESGADAEAAAACWERVRQAYARHLLIRLLGLGRPLELATVEPDAASVRIELSLSDAQARKLLDVIGSQIAQLTGFRPPAERATPPEAGSTDRDAPPESAPEEGRTEEGSTADGSPITPP